MKKTNDGSEAGMMVIEASISFMIFIIVTVSIIYLINIFTVHNRIQFAINSAANQLASYSYLYQAVGLRDAEKEIGADGEKYTKPIDDTATQVMDSLNKIQQVSADFGEITSSIKNVEMNAADMSNIYDSLNEKKENAEDAIDSVKKSASDMKNLLSDGNGLVAGMIYMAASGAGYEIKHAFGNAAAWVLTRNYLENNLSRKNADEYLESYGIFGGYGALDFSGSSVFCDSQNRMVDIVVEYDIDMGFAKLIIPDAGVHMVQRVSVAAWLDGDGQKVSTQKQEEQ